MMPDDCLGIRHETLSGNNFGLVSDSVVFSSAQFFAVLNALCKLRLIPYVCVLSFLLSFFHSFGWRGREWLRYLVGVGPGLAQ